MLSNSFLIGFEFICIVNKNKAPNRLIIKCFNTSCSPNLKYFNRKEIRIIWPILEIENWSFGDFFVTYMYTNELKCKQKIIWLFSKNLCSVRSETLCSKSEVTLLSVHLLQDKSLDFYLEFFTVCEFQT